MIDSYRIANDPTLYNGFRIIEKKQITAEDGMTFYTVQVDMNHPKTPYRLYVFTSDDKENHLCFVDSYMHKFKPKVNFIMSINGEDYYEIEKYIINNYNFNKNRHKHIDKSNTILYNRNVFLGCESFLKVKYFAKNKGRS